jgi:hypothetical protein
VDQAKKEEGAVETAGVPLALEEEECITGMKFEDAEVRFPGTTI